MTSEAVLSTQFAGRPGMQHCTPKQTKNRREAVCSCNARHAGLRQCDDRNTYTDTLQSQLLREAGMGPLNGKGLLSNCRVSNDNRLRDNVEVPCDLLNFAGLLDSSSYLPQWPLPVHASPCNNLCCCCWTAWCGSSVLGKIKPTMHIVRRQQLGQVALHATGLRPHGLCESNLAGPVRLLSAAVRSK